jgi:hypothetical protein
MLPAVLALMAWERRPASVRARDAGLLVGVGAAIKIVPVLLVPALLGSARSWREAAKLTIIAVGLPALTLLPLWLSDIDLHKVIAYTGFPGLGGLSLVVDPGLGWRWMTVLQPLRDGGPNGAGEALQDASRWITLAALAGYLGFVRRYRPAPIDAVVLLWLVIYVFSPNFFLNYMVWGLPFFIMAGYLAEVAILQVALIPAMVAFYLSRWPTLSAAEGVLYVPLLLALWVFWVVALVVVGRRIVRERDQGQAPIRAPIPSPEPGAG